MVITETTFSELVEFINTHPKWRRRLAKVLFPDLDIAKTFQRLVEAQERFEKKLEDSSKRTKRIEENVSTLKDRVELGFAQAASERAQAASERAEMKHDIAHLKGLGYESKIIQRADSIFGRFMRRGKNVRNNIGLLLEEAEDNGIITEQEHDQVLALDLLWGGKQKRSKADIVLAIEVSWRAEETDIERAVTRAKILRKIGLIALPVVAGLTWDEKIITFARKQNVAFIIDGIIDDESWQNAF